MFYFCNTLQTQLVAFKITLHIFICLLWLTSNLSAWYSSVSNHSSCFRSGTEHSRAVRASMIWAVSLTPVRAALEHFQDPAEVRMMRLLKRLRPPPRPQGSRLGSLSTSFVVAPEKETENRGLTHSMWPLLRKAWVVSPLLALILTSMTSTMVMGLLRLRLWIKRYKV